MALRPRSGAACRIQRALGLTWIGMALNAHGLTQTSEAVIDGIYWPTQSLLYKLENRAHVCDYSLNTRPYKWAVRTPTITMIVSHRRASPSLADPRRCSSRFVYSHRGSLSWRASQDNGNMGK